MSYGVIHYFPGGTREQYDASIAAVHPSATELPDGQVFHAAGPSQGGWTIIAVHDTRASWESFRDDIGESGLLAHELARAVAQQAALLRRPPARVVRRAFAEVDG